MDDALVTGPAQFGMDFGEKPKSYEPDRAEVRAELLGILETAQAANGECPWDARTLRYHRTVFPQMSRWLPDDEAERLRQAFAEAIVPF